MELKDILPLFKPEKQQLIPVLQKVQEELGFVSDASVNEISRYMKISPSEIYGVLTFYAQFRTKPTGKNLIMVCRGTACHIRGYARIMEAVKNTLRIDEGETTTDFKYTLETVACIGLCAIGPNMMVNKETYGLLSPPKVREIFSQK